MIDLALLAPTTAKSTDSILPSVSTLNTSSSVLAHSRRPAILTYTSTLVNTAHTLTTLPWYVLGWRKESEILEVPMFEGVEFAKGRISIPDSLKVTIEPEPDAKMQFYEAGVRIVARFGGLRWILYHHKFFSFFIFTTLFWSSSMLSMLLVWLGLSMYFASSTSDTEKEKAALKSAQREGYYADSNGLVKSEPADSDVAFDPTSLEDLSDTSRTFPTLGRGQAPLHFSGQQYRAAAEAREGQGGRGGGDAPERKIKKEAEEGEEIDVGPSSMIPPFAGLGTEADDEDEDEGIGSEWRDSGIGTSREEERREEIRRRRKISTGR